MYVLSDRGQICPLGVSEYVFVPTLKLRGDSALYWAEVIFKRPIAQNGSAPMDYFLDMNSEHTRRGIKLGACRFDILIVRISGNQNQSCTWDIVGRERASGEDHYVSLPVSTIPAVVARIDVEP